jgi:hypothetical protein
LGNAIARGVEWLWARPALPGAIFLALLYAGFYLGNSVLPGNNFDPCCVTGWIGFADQGRYYASVEAFAQGNLEAEQHWYPLGYALLATPFWFLRSHVFFAVDLAALLAMYAACLVFARRLGISTPVAVVIFLLTVSADPLLFDQWAIPWTTSPAAAAIWLLLAVTEAHLAGERRPFLLGLVAASLPLFRPTDIILSGICLAWAAIADFRAARLRWRDVALAAAGAAVLMVPYGALYLAIYGPHPTPYMVYSGRLGFTLHNPILRAFVLLIEPRKWFFDGQGLLGHMPWLILAFAGAIAVWRRGGAAALLSACLIAYCLLLLAYVDLLPTGLWRYYNIHYFKWTFPGFGLLAWLLIRELRAGSRLGWAALALVFLLSCLRVTPRAAAVDEPAVAIDMPGPAATEATTTMTFNLAVRDAAGQASQDIGEMRTFPFPLGDGVRLIGLKRDFAGDVAWVPGHGLPMPADPPPERRWAEQIGFGYPCWLPPHPCKKDKARK